MDYVTRSPRRGTSRPSKPRSVKAITGAIPTYLCEQKRVLGNNHSLFSFLWKKTFPNNYFRDNWANVVITAIGEKLTDRKNLSWHYLKKRYTGSVCGSVGRTVASNTRDPQFDSSHRQTFIKHLFTVNCVGNTKLKEKEAVNGPF